MFLHAGCNDFTPELLLCCLPYILTRCLFVFVLCSSDIHDTSADTETKPDVVCRIYSITGDNDMRKRRKRRRRWLIWVRKHLIKK